MENAVSFGSQAQTYATARPSYPKTLFEWIAEQSPSRNAVWDAGTGSGQAAMSLAQEFAHIHATDIDANQIAHAKQNERISYSVCEAHNSGLPDNSVDAITVATALHWFDFSLFWNEVKRVAQPNAFFCGWCYQLPQVAPDLKKTLITPIEEIIEPYWSEGNYICMRGYSKEELKMPFDSISTPSFSCELSWSPAQLAHFIRSWSAHKKARIDGHENALDDIEKQAIAALGDEIRKVVLPLSLLAARID